MARGEGGAEAAAIAALHEMRRVRRRRHTERIDVMEVLYRVYVGAIVGAIGLGVLGGVLNEAPVTATSVDWLREHGPAALGAVVAIAILGGLRTGAHGGPLAIEAAEVQYALMAPLRRGVALRATALRQLLIGALWGAGAGAVIGGFAFRRLPGSPVEWIAGLSLFCAFVPACFLAAAQLASGRHWGALRAGAVGLLLVAWTGADIAFGVTSSPLTMLGGLAVLPLEGGGAVALAAIAVALATALLAAGLLGLDGIRLEAARRRAELAAELRFSATTLDLRTVVLLRRQLASERSRRRPWLRLASGRPTRYPIWRRGWQSILRWPPARLVRALLIGAIAGALAAGAWSAAPPALFAPGLLLFLAGLDLIEPLAQESDHPTRRRLLPRLSGPLIISQLAVPATATALVLLVGDATAVALGGGSTALAVGLLLCAPIGFGIACCAAFSATANPYAHILAPEIELMPPVSHIVAAAPPLSAALLVGLPLLWAREAERLGHPPETAAAWSAVIVAVAAAVAAAFLGQQFAKRDTVTA